MTFNAGYPVWIDGALYPAALLREYEGGVTVQDAGTAAAVSPAGGVYPTTGAELQVIAPVSGMTVKVNAGYCAVPNTAGTGVYRFGLLTQASLTVAANSTGSTRQDIVVANVQDLETTGSAAQVEYITGSTSPPATPSNSIVLAQVAVPNSAANIVTGDITDMRTWVTPPGCVIPIANVGSAPTVPTGQLMYDIATGQLLYSPVTVVSETLTGSGNWTCPDGTTAVSVQAWGAGGGGDSLTTGAGGAGGGEYAAEPALSVTPGHTYSYSCGNGGGDGVAGGNTTFHGATVTVTAHGGVMVPSSATGGAGGTGSSNTIHFNGGSGGNGVAGLDGFGSGGGGGAAGSALGAGANGANATNVTPGAGGVAAGGGGGGSAGNHFGAANGGFPGGGGGGAGGVTYGFAGGTGGNGEITLNYVIAPGPSPYPLSPSEAVWFARNSSAGVIATAFGYYYFNYGYGSQTSVLSLSMTADGSSNYEISASVGNVYAPGSTTPAQLAILVDGVQRDAIYLKASLFGKNGCNWVWYTSGAQGTTMSRGNHTITLALSGQYGYEVQAIGPAVIRVARAVT